VLDLLDGELKPKGDKHDWFIVFLNFEYGSKAAIFLTFHQNEKKYDLRKFQGL
jgi:hypothetical protein